MNIPSGWKLKHIQNDFETFSGGTPNTKNDEYYKGTIPWIRSTEINQKIITETEKNISLEGLNNSSAKMVYPGYVLLALYGATAGEVAITNIEGAINQAVLAINAKNNASSNDYLYYYLSYHKDRIINKYVQGGQPNLSGGIIKNLLYLSPPRKEQQKIASILSTWDEAIEKYQNLLEQELRLMHSLKYIFFKEKESWMKTNLKSISRVVTGSTPPTSEEKYYHGNYVWVTPTDISEEKYISDSERKLSEEGFSKSRRLPAGTLLITSIASIGKNAILKVEGSCNQQINAIFPSENHSNEFLYYYLTYHKNDLLRYATTTATAMINKSTFEKIPIYVPELKIQKQIADILSLQDEKISSIRNMIIQLQEQKRGLMQLLLTGKVRV